MGVAATIRTQDRKPFGDIEDIQRALVNAFPGIQFTYHKYYRKQTLLEGIMNLLPGGVERALNRPSVKGCYGDFQANGLTAQFSFALEGSKQIDVEIWGTSAVVNEKFGLLIQQTGWQFKYD